MEVSERQIGKAKQAEVQAGANDRSMCGFRLNCLLLLLHDTDLSDLK